MKMLLLIFSTFTVFTIQLNAEEIIKIQIGKKYDKYSDSELRKRIWDLERAVFQLQNKVFELETKKNSAEVIPVVATWLCKTSAMGEKFTASGGSKAVAEDAVMSKCKASPNSSNGFHCGEPECSQ